MKLRMIYANTSNIENELTYLAEKVNERLSPFLYQMNIYDLPSMNDKEIELYCSMVSSENVNADIFIGIYSFENTSYQIRIGGQIPINREIQKNTFHYLFDKNQYLYMPLLLYHDVKIECHHPHQVYGIYGKCINMKPRLTIDDYVIYDMGNDNIFRCIRGMGLKMDMNQIYKWTKILKNVKKNICI